MNLCTIIISFVISFSDAYSDVDIKFSWISDGALWVDPDISLPQFTILGYNTLEHTAEYYGKSAWVTILSKYFDSIVRLNQFTVALPYSVPSAMT